METHKPQLKSYLNSSINLLKKHQPQTNLNIKAGTHWCYRSPKSVSVNYRPIFICIKGFMIYCIQKTHSLMRYWTFSSNTDKSARNMARMVNISEGHQLYRHNKHILPNSKNAQIIKYFCPSHQLEHHSLSQRVSNPITVA